MFVKKNNPKTFFKFPNVKKKKHASVHSASFSQTKSYSLPHNQYYLLLWFSMKIQRKHCHI